MKRTCQGFACLTATVVLNVVAACSLCAQSAANQSNEPQTAGPATPSARDVPTPQPAQTQPETLPPAPVVTQPQSQAQPAAAAPPASAPQKLKPTLPQIVVTAPSDQPKPASAKPKTTAPGPKAAASTSSSRAPTSPAPGTSAAPVLSAAEVAARWVATKTQALDTARDALGPKTGTNSYGLDQAAIKALPQGDNTPVEKVLLQAPGVTQDSAASGDFHIRNEHANVQFRINGIVIPDGVSGFGQLLETGFIGKLDLVTGALPAQYGFRTSGVVDITARTQTENGGSLGIYGGSHGTITPTFEYGGVTGQTQYYFTTRGLWNDQGLENPAPTNTAIHDKTEQGRAFGYTSTLLDPNTRLSTIFGIAVQDFQIPNRPNQPPQFTALGVSTFDSALLNERQQERNYYGVLALQRKEGNFDGQISYFTRYSSLNFQPDVLGDLVFNGVSSTVQRTSFLNGVQADGGYKINETHTLRAGIIVSAEQTRVGGTSTLLPVDAMGNSVDAPFNVTDVTSKLGWQLGTYIQDEWELSRSLTLNVGLRFDQMVQFIDANQFSPRASLTWKPLEGTVAHIGYARYFTPPSQVLAGPTNLTQVQGTTQQPTVNQASPVLPERAHYFDAGVIQVVLPGLEVGVSGYYKIAHDLIDDGQFGAAYVLNAFNYERGTNRGVELTAKYKSGPFNAYANFAVADQRATQLVSNQYLFDAATYAYISDHSVYTDHAQKLTASGGASYLLDGTRYSMSTVMGSGLRDGFANLTHVPGYAVVNLGLSREFKVGDGSDVKPTTVRFDILNVFDKVYEIRDGSGIGVFAPQYGERRGFFAGVSQKF